MSDVHVCVLAGGLGLRLWPLSTPECPKPFLKLPHSVMLIEQALERAQAIAHKPECIWLILPQAMLRCVSEYLPNFPRQQVIIEPVGRNTAAALCLAGCVLEQRLGRCATMLVLAADHYIPDLQDFVRVAQLALNRAVQGQSLLTMGLKPTEASTSYGYVQKGDCQAPGIYQAKAFVEKPPVEQARQLLASDQWYWNSGMFAWRTDVFFSEVALYMSDFTRIMDGLANQDDLLDLDAYGKLPNVSIDYALMEKSNKVEVVLADFVWSDLGTWQSVAKVLQSDGQGNRVSGCAVVIGGQDNVIHAQDKLVVIANLTDIVVVVGPQAILVTSMQQSGRLKQVLEQLPESKGQPPAN